MTLLSDMIKKAKAAAKEKNQEKQTNTKTNTTTTKKTPNLTQEQRQQAINSINNIKNQGVIKGSITNAKQGAETKAEKSFYNRSTDKEISAYKTMVNEGYTPAEARKAIDTITTQKRTVTYTRPKQEKTVDTWTDKQQNAYDTLVSEGYSEKEAKKAVQKAIQKDWSTGKKIWTGVKSFGQGVSDVGQRTVGRAIDWAAGKIVDLTGLDEKFGEYTPQTQTSILSDEEASSRVGTVGRKAGEITGATALSMAAGNVAGGGARAIGTAAGSKLLGGVAGTVLGAGEGALSSDIFARGLEDRAATKQERTLGAVAGGILGGIGGYRATAKALNENKQLAGLVQDTSKAGKERAIAEGRTTTKKGLFGTTQEQQLSQQEKDAIKIIKNQKLGKSKNPQTLYNNVKKEIAKTAGDMSDDMKNIKVKDWSKQGVKDALQDLKDSPETRNSVKKTIDNLIKRLDTVDNADDLWKIRRDYDNLFTAGQKAGYGKGGTTEAMYDAWQEGRRILNNAMQKAGEDAGSQTVKEGMKRLSTLINAENNMADNILKQVGKESKNRLGRNRKEIAKRGGIGVIGKAGYDKLTK